MITPIRTFNPTFRQKYVNYDNTTVSIDEEGIKQAKIQMHIRKSVEESIKQSEDKSVKYGDVYFTLFSDGSCKLSKNKVQPIWYGKANSVNVNQEGWISSEINAKSVSCRYRESSDEGGAVRKNGRGYKFATIYPDGEIYIRKIAEEIFPEK